MDIANSNSTESTATCRICLYHKGAKNIFKYCHYLRLQKLLHVEFCRGDGLPEEICLECEKRLLDAYTFMELCLHSNAELTTTHSKKSNGISDTAIKKEDVFLEDIAITDKEDGAYNYGTSESPVDNENYLSESDLPLNKINEFNAKVKYEFVCSVCNKFFPKKRELRHHEKSEHEIYYPCVTCKKFFKNKRSLRIHFKTHTGERPHVCELCGHRFSQKSGLNRHSLTHGERTFMCSFCQAAFKQRSVLVQHLLIHTGERRHCCDFCGIRFTQSGQLLVHLKYKHAETLPERIYKCEFCSKNFALKGSLKRHVQIHEGVLDFSCAQCDKKFRTKILMMNHFKRMHLRKKEFKCNHCIKEFVTKYELIQHMVVHTNVNFDGKGNLFNLRSVQCLQCGMWFANKERLRKHKLVHSMYRKYACELCPRKFYTGTNYRRHLKIHDKK